MADERATALAAKSGEIVFTVRDADSAPIPPDEFVDWRTIDVEWLQDQGVPVEELEVYRESLQGLLYAHPGGDAYVLIVGRKVVATFPDLEMAVGLATLEYPGRRVFIKKLAALEPVRSLGGAALATPGGRVGR